jgi:hypothetical protein
MKVGYQLVLFEIENRLILNGIKSKPPGLLFSPLLQYYGALVAGGAAAGGELVDGGGTGPKAGGALVAAG